MDAEVLCPETDTAAATYLLQIPLKVPVICSALETSERKLDTSRETGVKKHGKARK